MISVVVLLVVFLILYSFLIYAPRGFFDITFISVLVFSLAQLI